MNPTAGRSLVLRNNIALAGWVFMAIWMGMLCLFTWMAIRDHGLPGVGDLTAVGVLALFWLFGAAGCAHVLGQACVTLAIDGHEVRLSERRGWSRREERFALADLRAPSLAEEKDSDGDPYYRCQIATPAGRTVTVCEHGQRAIVETACTRLAKIVAERSS